MHYSNDGETMEKDVKITWKLESHIGSRTFVGCRLSSIFCECCIGLAHSNLNKQCKRKRLDCWPAILLSKTQAVRNGRVRAGATRAEGPTSPPNEPECLYAACPSHWKSPLTWQSDCRSYVRGICRSKPPLGFLPTCLPTFRYSFL